MNIFSTKRTLAAITPKKIQIAQVSLGEIGKLTNSKEFDWIEDPSTLTSVAKMIEQKYPTKLRLLVDEAYSYSTVVEILSKEVNESKLREQIASKVIELVPEDLNSTLWDFKEITFPTNFENKSRHFQISVITKEFFDLLQEAFGNNTITIELLEPLSYVIARNFHQTNEPYIAYLQNPSENIIVGHGGNLLYTNLVKEKISIDKFLEVKNIAEKKFGIEIKKIFLIDDIGKELQKQLAHSGFEIIATPLNIISQLAINQDISGDDKNILNLKTMPTKTNQSQPLYQSEPNMDESSDARAFTPKIPMNNIKITILSILLLGIIIYGLVLLSRNRSNSQSTSQPTPIPTVTEIVDITQVATSTPEITTATPEPEPDKSQFKIQIQNGNGKPGVANTLEGILKEEGYTILNKSNADSFNYTNTVVKYKPGTHIGYITSLDKVLTLYYPNLDHEDLPIESDYDVIIIIGKNE